MPSRTYIERNFQGVNTYIAPAELGPGLLTQCDNLRVDGGDLVTRPGLQGVLTAAHGAPIYGLFAYVTSNGTQLLYSSNGRLYRYAVNPPTPVTPNPAEVLFNGNHFALNSPGVMLERAGKYVYGIDGSGPLFRVTETDAHDVVGQSVAGLIAPTSALSAALTSQPIDNFDAPSAWTASSLPTNASNNQLPDGGLFTNWSNPNNPGGGWTPDNVDGTIDFEFLPIDTNGDGTRETLFLRMDDTGSKFHLTDTRPNVAYAGTTYYARQFKFKASYNAHLRSDAIGVTVTVYSDSPGTEANRIAEQEQIFTAADVNQNLSWESVFSFAELDEAIQSYRITYRTVSGTGGTNGPYLGKLFLAPVDPGVSFSTSGGHVGINAPTTAGVAPVGGVHLVKSLAAATDFSGLSHLSIGYAPVAGYTGFGAVLGLRKATGNPVYTNPVIVAVDGKSLNVDISTLSEDDRTAIEYVEIVLSSSLTITSPGSVLFVLGPLTSAGNLSVGYADYQWLYTEVQNFTASGDPPLSNLLESNPTPVSNVLTPTDTKAQAILALPTRPNNVNTGATHFRIYRFGGVVGQTGNGNDGLYRLIGTWQFGTDGKPVDETDRLATYAHVATGYPNGTVTDNVPDADLIGETTIADFGRDSAPEGAQAICFYQGRLGLAVGSQFYWSWLVDSEGAAGLYFNTFLDPNDPQAAIKGGVYPIGGDDNDPITRLEPFASQLILWKSRSAWLGVGSDALDLRVQQYLSGQGVGCVAPRGGGKVGNQIWVRGADSFYQFDADTVDDRGTAIEKQLNPQGATEDAFLYHQRRAFLIGKSYDLATGAGATANDIAWLYDTRTEQYVRYTGFSFTGGASLAAGENTDSAYFSGYDGQIYQLTGTGYKSSPSSTESAVMHWTAKTRAFGTDTGREITATHALCELSVKESTALTLTVQEDGGSRTASASYTLSAGEKRLRLRLPPGQARGRALTVMATGASSMPLRIQALGLETVTGAREST